MKLENIHDYLQGIRDFEDYQRTHNLREELEEAFPIGTKLKPVDGTEYNPMDKGMEVIGAMIHQTLMTLHLRYNQKLLRLVR